MCTIAVVAAKEGLAESSTICRPSRPFINIGSIKLYQGTLVDAAHTDDSSLENTVRGPAQPHCQTCQLAYTDIGDAASKPA